MSDGESSLFQPRILIPFLIVTLIWGSTWLVITGQLGEVPAIWSVTYRFAIAAVAMFAYAVAVGSSLRIGREGHWLAALSGVPQFCFNHNAVYLAEHYVTSGLVAVIFALLPLPNALLAWLFLKHRISRNFLIGSLVAVLGVTLLFIHELRASPISARDVILGLAFSLIGLTVSSAANVAQAAERLRSRSLPSLIAWGMAYGVAANLVLAILFGGPPRIETSFVYVGGLLYLGLIGSALAFTLYFRIIRDVGPGKAAYSSLLIPIVAMLLSTLFESYRWSAAAGAGAVLALTGLFIALRARRSEAART